MRIFTKGVHQFTKMDGFQGQEADLVILDLTIPSRFTDSLLCRDPTTFSATKLLNAVLTRTRQKLVVVGAAQDVGKGDLIGVMGKLTQRQWETDEGEKRSKVEVQAFEVHLVRKKKGSESV